jgi:UMF1 family MFS transporter
MTAATPIDQRTYRRRINAWAMYDWANSAFVTTVIAAIMPAYYSQVAGATLPSPAVATRYWSLGLSMALFISAIISPVLGTVSDVIRGKKRFLAFFLTIGVISTGFMVLISTGDWLLASILVVIGRIGMAGSNVFYDSLLPHVAKEEDQDAVSSRGYALGYLGGGILLAINVVMFNIPDDVFGFPFAYAGIRLSFLSVAVWWAVFSFPLFLQIPEPAGVETTIKIGRSVWAESFSRLRETFRDIQQYRELFKYLVAFLIYNDGIGTIIGVAVIYGAELGFETTELVLALLLVQFVGIPFSFVFGNLPNRKVGIRHYYLAFILFNVVALPIAGIGARYTLTTDITGAPVPPYEAIADFLGEGRYTLDNLALDGAWEQQTIAANLLGTDDDGTYAFTTSPDDRYSLQFNGQEVELIYATGPDFGIYTVEIDGEPLVDNDGDPVTVSAYNRTLRYGVTRTFMADDPGEHTLTIINTGESALNSTGTQLAIGGFEVQPPIRGGNIPIILGMILGVQALAALFAFVGGARLFKPLSEWLNTQNAIVLSLVIYGLIAIWGFFLNSTVEFWFLAWMVGIVQGGSQALSRSLYATMSPKEKSGEFFGLFSVMAKFSAITGPLLFAFATIIFGSSRPAILSLILLFIIGGYLLTRVDVDAGRQAARMG